MSKNSKKKLEKVFQVKDPKEKWKLIYQFYDEKALRIIDSQLIVENKDFLIKTLNEFNEKIDAKLKKSKPVNSNVARSFLIIHQAMLNYYDIRELKYLEAQIRLFLFFYFISYLLFHMYHFMFNCCFNSFFVEITFI